MNTYLHKFGYSSNLIYTSVLQIPALFRMKALDVHTTTYILLVVIIIFIFLLSKKYKWNDWSRLWGKVAKIDTTITSDRSIFPSDRV